MVAFTPGTDGTIKQTNLEAALLEAFFLLESYEGEATANNVSINSNFNAKTASVNFTFQVTPAVVSGGDITLEPQDYLGTTTYAPGTGGTIDHDSLPVAIVDLLHRLAISEADPTLNPNNTTRLTMNYSARTGVLTGTVNFDLLITNANGLVNIEAKENLVAA